jgi:hypothetical protein
MREDIKKLKESLGVSFSYVKKDMLLVNDSLTELYDKIQHLSMNHASLLGKIANLEKQVAEKKVDKLIIVKKKQTKKSSAKKVQKKKVQAIPLGAPTLKGAKKIIKETVVY